MQMIKAIFQTADGLECYRVIPELRPVLHFAIQPTLTAYETMGANEEFLSNQMEVVCRKYRLVSKCTVRAYYREEPRKWEEPRPVDDNLAERIRRLPRSGRNTIEDMLTLLEAKPKEVEE